MKNKLKTVVAYAVGMCVLATFIAFTCVNFGSAPNDRTVYYIDNNNVYYSPPLMHRDPRPFAYSMFTQDAIDDGFQPLDERIKAQTDYEGLVYANPKTKRWVVNRDTRDYIPVATITREELREIADRKPDEEHREASGFQDWCGPFTWALRKLGFAKARFTEIGDWNW